MPNTSIVTSSEFLAEYPDFARFEDILDTVLARMETLYCPASVWILEDGDTTTQRHGIMLRTAHHLECKRIQWAKTAAMGVGISQGQPVSVSPASEKNLNSTEYGTEFDQLRRSVVGIGAIGA